MMKQGRQRAGPQEASSAVAVTAAVHVMNERGLFSKTIASCSGALTRLRPILSAAPTRSAKSNQG